MENINLDRTHDLLNLTPHPLRTFFHPRNIALIGATEREDSVGRTTFENLLNGGFTGKIFAVNSTKDQVLGQRAYRSVGDIQEPIDLVIVTTPAATVPAVIQECVNMGIPSAVIISAGFKEVGPAGKKLEDEVLKIAHGKMRIIGPNCLGIMSPIAGVNATFAQTIAKPGNVAFISQSGALCTAILDSSLTESFGFSGFISTGSMADVSWGDLIDYFGSDPNTKSIVIYMESIGNARAFLSAARELALSKPIIVIKAGRTSAAAKAAASHTGSLTGSDEVLDAAFRRCGVLRVDQISEVFHMADVLGKQPLPAGKKLAIVTNAGGPGVLATDALVDGGGELAQLSQETISELSAFLPAAWSHANPVDVLGDAGADRIGKTLEKVVQESDSDGILVITTPQGMTDLDEIAKILVPYAKNNTKPIFASWMGAGQAEDGIRILNAGGIPTFSYPDEAAEAFNYMWKSRENLKMLYETPEVSEHVSGSSAQTTNQILKNIRAKNREILTEYESKQLLETYGIPTVPTKIATSADGAVAVAEQFGFPIVLKLHSETITHKTDVGGVILNLSSAGEVREAFNKIKENVSIKASSSDFLGVTVQPMSKLKGYEVILGSSVDPQFGPVLLFGTGGELVEVYKDRSLALPPLNTTLARRMMESTKIYTALKGVRGRKPVDLLALENILVKFSELVLNHPEIKEIDINPLVISSEGMIALDARVVLYSKDVNEFVRSAIRSYPSQYSESIQTKNKQEMKIRAIRPEDELRIRDFHKQLSDKSVQARYQKSLSLDERTTHERLTRVCFIDYDREMCLVVTEKNSAEKILAVGRLRKDFLRTKGELSLVVADAFHGQGLGQILIEKLIGVAKAEGLSEVWAQTLKDNTGMIKIFEKLNFNIEAHPKDSNQVIANVKV